MKRWLPILAGLALIVALAVAGLLHLDKCEGKAAGDRIGFVLRLAGC